MILRSTYFKTLLSSSRENLLILRRMNWNQFREPPKLNNRRKKTNSKIITLLNEQVIIMYKKQRPIVITVVAILEMLVGALVLLLGGLFLIASLGLLGEDFTSVWEETIASTLGAVFGILAAGVLFVGFLVFIVGYGLWKLSSAAWWVSTIVYGLLSISISLNYNIYLSHIQASNFSDLLIPIITIGLFIYFLTVKDKFS